MTVGHQQKERKYGTNSKKVSCCLYMLFSLPYQRPRFFVYPFPCCYTAVLKTLVRELRRRILLYTQLLISKRAPGNSMLPFEHPTLSRWQTVTLCKPHIRNSNFS